jgi:hypothetical protein
VTTALATEDPALAAAVLRHLDVQRDSARRLLDLVLAQGRAIRERDVATVLERLADVKAEMANRETLDEERTGLILQAALRLGAEPSQVTLDALARLMPPDQGAAAYEASAELRGLLAEIAREHGINRALMRQELSFLDHLVRLIGDQPDAGGSRLMDVEA